MIKNFIVFYFLLFFSILFSQAQTVTVPCAADAQVSINDACPWQSANYGSSVYLPVNTWTWYGPGCAQGSMRSLLLFNFNNHGPQQLYDNRATLNLYFPTGSTETHNYTGSATDNQFYIQRVTASWAEMTVTWDTQPMTTTTGQILVPSSSTNPSTQDYFIDVSTMVLDWVCNTLPNYGMRLKLVNEGQTYRRVTFTSREYITDTARHPKLILEYAYIATSAPDTVCEDDSFNISCLLTNAYNPSAYQFQWTHLNSGTTYNIQNVVGPAYITGLNTYVVHVSNPWCETATDTVTVFVAAKPDANASYNSPLCEGDTLQLTVSAADNYQWTGPNSFSSNLQNPFIPDAHISNNGVYTVTVSNSAGCDSTVSLNVTINQNPVAVIMGNTQVCQEDTVHLTASGGSGYLWSTGGSANTELVVPMTDTAFYVTVTDINGCRDSSEITIVTWPLPLPVIASVPETCTGAADGFAIATSTEGMPPYSYVWGNGQNSDTVTGIGAGNYSVTVTDANGCTGSQSAWIAQAPNSCYTPEIVIPNVFTPNSDGVNDVFFIKDIEYFKPAKLEIYNRWGKTIYTSEDYNNDWTGKKYADGVYYYLLVLNNGEEYQGTLTLLR